MKYILSLDWLSLYCTMEYASEQWQGVSGNSGTIGDAYPWKYEVMPYGTRQYKNLTKVAAMNEQGGWDEFAEVQSAPYSGILDPRSVIVRFVNRQLYKQGFWGMLEQFLQDNEFTFRSISRIDICADFNTFDCCTPLQLIEGFAAKKYRHVGRGVGALYFDHGLRRVTDSQGRPTDVKEYGVHYTGLSFGTHESDARVYLYNKTFELAVEKDKPYIRDTWKSIGLDVRDVWRLEVSIKSKAKTFKWGKSSQTVTIDLNAAKDSSEVLPMIYLGFVKQLFAFVVNRKGITNISREPRLQLFRDGAFYDRAVIRNVSGGGRLEKILIKGLYTLGKTYRGVDDDVTDMAQSFAVQLAESADLGDWMSRKVDEWTRETYK